MPTPIEQARSAATVILSTASHIVAVYSQQENWYHPQRGLTVPALQFGEFLREVIEAPQAVNAVANQLIDAKRDDHIVRLGTHCERTGHQVAIKFARQVGSIIWLNLWLEGDDGPYGTAFEPWPIDGLDSDRHLREFQQRWPNICDALSKIKPRGIEEIYPLILLESRRAQQIEPATNSIDTADNAPDVRHSEDFRSVWWYGTRYEFTGNQAAVVEKLWNAWLNKTPELSSTTLGDAADSTCRMSVIFRGNSAYGEMIVKVGKDKYRLKEPENTDDPNLRP